MTLIEMMLAYPIGAKIESTEQAKRNAMHNAFKSVYGDTFTVTGYEGRAILVRNERGPTAINPHNWKVVDDPD